jgi:3-hydroxyacyl-CoA dehydrogenase
MQNLADSVTDEAARAAFASPQLVSDMVGRGWLGAKAGQGFYKRAGDDILTLDVATMEYRPKQSPRLAALDAALGMDSVDARLRALFFAPDKTGRFLRDTLGELLLYAARVTPRIAHSIDDVDRAMRWGFGWELGPFETWDALGVHAAVDALGVIDLPPLLAEAREKGAFRPVAGSAPRGAAGRVPPAGPDFEVLRSAREQGRMVRGNSACSLVDIGDGVLAVEFHAKMNAIGGDAIEVLEAGIAEAAANFRALVVGNEAVNFSAGANLLLLLLEAQEGNWDEIDLMVRGFQRAALALKYADVPVVAAPAGLALGGACEVCLHADRVVAAAETYMGLPEAGVGLIPAAGGTKEMLRRAMLACGEKEDPLPHVQRVFETIAFGRVSTSAVDARRHGYLRQVDSIVMNRDRLISSARSVAVARAGEYVRPRPAAIRVGGEGLGAALKLGVFLAWRGGRISDHDALIGRKLAWVLSGGSLGHLGTLTEQQLLDLEREAFLSLCGEPRTLERIAHTLKTGKPLRN